MITTRRECLIFCLVTPATNYYKKTVGLAIYCGLLPFVFVKRDFSLLKQFILENSTIFLFR